MNLTIARMTDERLAMEIAFAHEAATVAHPATLRWRDRLLTEQARRANRNNEGGQA